MVRRHQIYVLVATTLVVILTSFASGLYLMFKPAEPARVARQGTETVPELLRKAGGLLKEKQIEQALVFYRSALSLAPGSFDAQTGVAQAELLAGREEVAAREYERVLLLDPSNRQTLWQLAQIYSHRSASWELAENRLRKLLSIQRDDAAAMLQLARVLAWQEKSKAAAELFGKPEVTKLATRQDRADYAFALVKSGLETKAESVLKTLIAEGGAAFNIRLQLASLYAARKDWNSALPLYQKLVAERPMDPSLNLAYGLGLLATGSHRAALEPLGIARGAMPSKGEVRLAYARALKGAGELKRADGEFRQALPLLHEDAAIHREYGDLLLERREYRRSAQEYKRAYELGLRDTTLLVRLAGALRGDRKPREALPYLEAAYRSEPTDRIAFELARLYHDLGSNDRAREYLSRVEGLR